MNRPFSWKSLAFLMTAAQMAAGADAPMEDRTQFQSGGKAIAVERFAARSDGKLPGVLILHGSDGLEKTGDLYRAAARQLASRGYVVAIVHYFDLTATRSADKATIDQHFFGWVGVVHDGLAFLRRQPNVDAARIGLVGYSLGGYLSLSSAALALRDEHRVSAIVEYCGGLPKMLSWNVKSLPPVLIFHGDADPVVPVREARDLAAAMQRAGGSAELHIYPGQGHGFSGKFATESTELGMAYLDKHLAR